MSAKVLLLLFVFYTAIAVVHSGSVAVEACNSSCDYVNDDGPKINKCCNDHQYRRGHCSFFWFTGRAWCDDHY